MIKFFLIMVILAVFCNYVVMSTTENLIKANCKGLLTKNIFGFVDGCVADPGRYFYEQI